MVTLDVSRTVFEILMYTNLENSIFLIPPLLDAPAQGESVRISGWHLSRKTKGMSYLQGENCTIVTSRSTCLTDRQTDGR